METQHLVQDLGRFDVKLFTLGGTPITVWDIGFIVVALVALFWFTAFLKRWTARRLAEHTHLDEASQQTLGTLVRYFTLVVGFLVIMQAAGINLTTFHVLAGAIGVGVGFGLQNIVSNFICGLIVMFERPVKVGDRVQVGDVEGSVIEIGARATTVLTLDNVAAIVPNQKLIIEVVKNWQHGSGTWQLRIAVPAKYGSDLDAVRDAMLAVAAASRDVLHDPPPAVRLATLAGGSLGFEMRLQTTLGVTDHPDLVSELNFALRRDLDKRGIALKQ